MLSVPRNITKQSNGPAQILIRMNVLVTWSEKQRLSRIWKWTKIKSLIAIFSGFFCSEFLSKCTANSLQKFNPSDFRKPEQKCHFAFFRHIWQSHQLCAIQKQFILPKRNSIYLGATGTNFLQIVLNSRLRWLKTGFLCHIIGYRSFNFLKRKNKIKWQD